MWLRGESRQVIRTIFQAALLAAAAFAWVFGGHPAHAETGLPYTVEIVGVEDTALRNLLRQSSQLAALRETPPATVTGIRRRAQLDLDRLTSVLHAEGYYAGAVAYEVDGNTQPVTARLNVTPGELFHLRRFDVTYTSPVGAAFPQAIADFPDARGQPANGRFVLALQAQLIDRLQDGGYPFADVTDRIAEAHMAEAKLEVTLTVDPGPLTRFGAVHIVNPTRARDTYIYSKITWEPGAPFSRQALRDTHAALEATGIFSDVTVEPAAEINPGGTLDVTIEVAERKPRTVGVGVRYGTSEGAGARTYWEHRNLWGRAERLRLEADVAEINQTASVELNQPGFLRADQDLITTLSVFHIVAESYDETGVAASVGLSRRLTQRLRAQAGVEGRVSVVDEGAMRRDTRLIRFPLGFSYDSTDNVLDPTEGIRASLSVAPTVGDSETALFYVKSDAHVAGYFAVDDDARAVLAFRARLGAIAGEANLDLPASERFYSGGGGSVRGIGYQLAGPVDATHDPIGGRSVLEVGAEARLRVTDRIGVVPFIEGGTVFTNDVPNLSEDLRWGAGLGIRYYTAFGPIRLDVATPLNRREGIDDVVQFYISLGQAF